MHTLFLSLFLPFLLRLFFFFTLSAQSAFIVFTAYTSKLLTQNTLSSCVILPESSSSFCICSLPFSLTSFSHSITKQSDMNVPNCIIAVRMHARTRTYTRQGPVQSPSIQAKPCDSGSLIRNMSAAQQRHISVQQQQQQQHAVRHPASPPRTPPSSRRDRSVGCALTSLHREAAEVARHWCRIDQPIRSGVTAATGIPLRLTSR